MRSHALGPVQADGERGAQRRRHTSRTPGTSSSSPNTNTPGASVACCTVRTASAPRTSAAAASDASACACTELARSVMVVAVEAHGCVRLLKKGQFAFGYTRHCGIYLWCILGRKKSSGCCSAATALRMWSVRKWRPTW